MTDNHQGAVGFILDDRLLFDVSSERLERTDDDAVTYPLQPDAARVLRYLVRSPQVVLSRRQIGEACWQGRRAEDAESGLNQAIRSLREVFALADPSHAYIRTLPRIGYCLLAHVLEV